MTTRAATTATDPCGVGDSLALFTGRWKGPILWWLRDSRRRFGELKKRIPQVTPRVLANQLRQLERDGLITREQFLEMPPRVEYSITPLGETMLPLLDQIRGWGERHLAEVAAARAAFGGGSDETSERGHD